MAEGSSSGLKRNREKIEDSGEHAAILNRMKHFWFAMKADVLNPDLSQIPRPRTIMEFNAGSFDYLIVIRDGEANATQQEAQLGGAELKNVHTVINFQMPRIAAGYMYRIGHTGREVNTRASVSLVSPDEMEAFKELKSTLAAYRSGEEEFITPFRSLTKNVLESLRYRAEDMERSVTRVDVRNAR